jgi:hypothetical protein
VPEHAAVTCTVRVVNFDDPILIAHRKN